jgi:hypothetical protein
MAQSHNPTSKPHLRQTATQRQFLESTGDIAPRVLKILNLMEELHVNLPLFLWAISWNVKELVSNSKARFARTALMMSDELPVILSNWHKPPRRHNAGIRTKAAKQAMEHWALETLYQTFDEELSALAPTMELPQEELSEETLLSIRPQEMISEVQTQAPVLWKLISHLVSTPDQASNTLKCPVMVDSYAFVCILILTVLVHQTSLAIVSMASFSRSHHRSKLPKLLTVYFKSCGLATKAFDTLHALGITMSQKWAYRGIEQLSGQVRSSLLDEIEKYPWFGTHDNINIAFKVYEQRLNNQSHFDSGTAATIFIIKDPAAISPNNLAFQQKRAIGAKDLITWEDILELEATAGLRIRRRAIHQVLSFLFNAPAFDFKSYSQRNHSLLKPPVPVHQLPLDAPYAIYMLNTVHIEEASYEGNDRVLKEWWRQLKFDTPEKQRKLGEGPIIVWTGDQLTVSRIRGLQKFRSEDDNTFDRLSFLKEIFGWFHTVIALEHSLHDQYYGTRNGFGLVHDFDLLNRKGLNTHSVQGTFHHHLNEALRHIAAARFRDLWLVVGKVDKLEELRNRSPQELLALATSIVDDYASTAGLRKMEAQQSRKDELLYQSAQMARDLLDYIDINDAIMTGDVGCIQDQLPRLLFRFGGGKNKNYTNELLELLQGLLKEWPDDLK